MAPTSKAMVPRLFGFPRAAPTSLSLTLTPLKRTAPHLTLPYSAPYSTAISRPKKSLSSASARTAAIKSPPEDANRARWIERLKLEHGDRGWQKIVRVADERDARKAARQRGKTKAGAAAGMGKTAPGLAAAAKSSEAFWAAKVKKAKELAEEVQPTGKERAGPTGSKEGKAARARPGGKGNEEEKVKELLTPAEKAAARRARAEELRNAFIAKLKAEYGAGWEAKMRDSEERKARTAARNREQARLAKMASEPKIQAGP